MHISKIAYRNVWQQCNAWLHHHYFLPPTSVIQSNYMSSLSNLLCTIKGMQNIKGTCRDKYTPELEKRNIFVKISKSKTSICIITLNHKTSHTSYARNSDTFDIYSAFVRSTQVAYIRINSRKLNRIVTRLRTMNFDTDV